MELAATYSVSDATRSAFVYLGLPGEPALGPPAFMHRFSGAEIPESPIGHHWLDSTHITYGVATAGVVRGGLKLEASSFTGREPDQDRADFEKPKFDSQAVRVSFNPAPRWSFETSYGSLKSPEQLEPDVDTRRTVASAMYDAGSGSRRWQTLLAWGRNRNRPGRTLDAWLLESALTLGGRHTVMARAERVEKDELFPPGDPRDGRAFTVGKLGAGYVYDLRVRGHAALGLGAYGSLSLIPASLEGAYGSTPRSGMVFARLRVR
jgi:hypothetical protein